MSRGRATGHERSFYRDVSRKFRSSHILPGNIRSVHSPVEKQDAIPKGSNNKCPIDHRYQRVDLHENL